MVKITLANNEVIIISDSVYESHLKQPCIQVNGKLIRDSEISNVKLL